MQAVEYFLIDDNDLEHHGGKNSIIYVSFEPECLFFVVTNTAAERAVIYLWAQWHLLNVNECKAGRTRGKVERGHRG